MSRGRPPGGRQRRLGRFLPERPRAAHGIREEFSSLAKARKDSGINRIARFYLNINCFSQYLLCFVLLTSHMPRTHVKLQHWLLEPGFCRILTLLPRPFVILLLHYQQSYLLDAHIFF